MRRLALGVLVVTCGCNQIFGVRDTTEIDAALPDAAPVTGQVFLTWGIATPSKTGQPAPSVALVPIGSEQLWPTPPMVQVGPIPTSDLASHMLSVATYDNSTGAAGGSLVVPQELLGRSWRLVYQLPLDPVPHEVQWMASSAYLVIPRLTRVDAAPVPLGSGYSIAPMGASGILAPIVMTSGVFTWTNSDMWTSSTIDLHYAAYAKPLTGPKGAPDPTLGDWILATDWGAPSPDESSVSAWALCNGTSGIPLAQGTQTSPAVEPLWNVGSLAIPIQTAELTAQSRLSNNLSGLSGTYQPRMSYGISPNTLLPGFLADRKPNLLPLEIVPRKILSSVTVNDPPSSAIPLERVLYVAATNTRMVGSVALETAIEVVVKDLKPTADWPAALTRGEKLDALPLSADGQLYKKPADQSGMDPTITLSFSLDGTASGTADDVVITLYEVNGKLTPVRTYEVPGLANSVAIERSVLVAGHTYVFAFTTRTGYPDAEKSDYRHVTYPFGQSTKFAGTFVVQ